MIYIWIRQTVDWRSVSSVYAQLPDGFAEKVNLWNRSFNIPYHLFRNEIKQIASLNHSKVEDASVAKWEEIPNGALVAPVDDDDWFSPSLGKVLRDKCHSGVTGYYWPSSFLEVPIDWRHEIGKSLRTIMPFIPPKWLCTTNNYALVKTEATRDLLLSHTKSSEWFNIQDPHKVMKLKPCLSVMNRTLASRTSLRYKRSILAGIKLRLSFIRYKKLYHRPLPEHLIWAEPYRKMMADLMNRLTFRK